jgi:hypothetical protein
VSSRRLCSSPVFLEAAPLCALLLTAGGCEDRVRPWEGKPGPAPVLSAAPPRPTLPLPAGLDGAGGGDGGAAQLDPELPALPVRVGGPWVRCYGNFRLSGDPLKDLTRLSLLCGPENGMWRLTKTPIEGRVSEGQPGVSQKLKAVRGECYRVFAVGGPGVLNLDITLQSSRGATIASDGGEDAWPIVQPDRPFCPLEDDTVTVEISAKRGEGRFAAEVWVLKTPERPTTHPPQHERDGAEPYEEL